MLCENHVGELFKINLLKPKLLNLYESENYVRGKQLHENCPNAML